MSIFSRTRDIVAANVTDLLSKSEDPVQTIRVIILEMEETLVEVRASAARSIADQKEMRRQIDRLEDLQASWTEKAELALSKGRDDLARAALVEREKVAEMAARLGGEIAVIDEALSASQADIFKLQSKLREARARQSSLSTRLESAHNRTRMREMYAGARVDDAFSKFELLERDVDMAEGQADALLLALPPKSLAEEIAELRNAEKVDAELERMKQRRLAA
jgi:phage shock protein A